jgi:hypothetical protein
MSKAFYDIMAMAIIATLGGCDTAPDGQADDLHQQLLIRNTFGVDQQNQVGLVITDGTTDISVESQASGIFVVRATDDGFLLMEALDVTLSEVSITDGVDLIDLRLRLGTQLAIDPEWNPQSAYGSGAADLLLDWSMRDHEAVYALSTQKMKDATFRLEVEQVDDIIHVGVSAETTEGSASGSPSVQHVDFSFAAAGTMK